MPDVADYAIERAQEYLDSQIAKQLNAAARARKLSLRNADGTCLNGCGFPVEMVEVALSPAEIAAAAESGIQPASKSVPSLFCSRECAADAAKRERTIRKLNGLSGTTTINEED